VLRTGWKPRLDLKGVIPISEELYPQQRELILEAFRPARVLVTYGLSEKTAIAGELPGQPGAYEIEPLYGITEIIGDDGCPVTIPGETGRIVGTGFISTSMPLLRYDTGDLAQLVRPATRGNCYRMQIRSIKPRRGQEFVAGINGELISITSINIHSPLFSRIQEFQLFQDQPGEIIMRVVPAPGFGTSDIQPIVDEIQSKVGSSASFKLALEDSLETNARGKRKLIDQRLDLDAYQV
jgi:phenylacetate-CoA ligase